MDLAAAIETVRQADAALAETSTPFPLPIGGLEAVVVGTVTALERGDWWVPGMRERVGAVLRDTPVERLSDGLAGARPYKVAPPSTSPALRALVATGIAVGTPDRFTAVHLGIGSVADGAFHEALNLAALTGANVCFVVAVHPLDGDAPVGPQCAASPSGLAKAFGLTTTSVDGNNARKVHDAVAKARKKGGPHLVEATLDPSADITAN